MKSRCKLIYVLLVSGCLLGWSNQSLCQLTVKGTVYNMSKTYPVEGVSVLSSSGKGTVTSASGSYTLVVNEKDSIYFSYLNKSTMRFAITSIADISQFDISINAPTSSLPPVQVMPPSYKYDSTQNRQEYAKAFNFRKPGFGITSAPGSGAGVGLDLDELINVFRFRRNKSMLGFQKRLLQEEEDKFIDHRFSKIIVRKVTLLTGRELDYFMKLYRPSYDFTLIASDYEFAAYIKQSYMRYRAVYPGRR